MSADTVMARNNIPNDISPSKIVTNIINANMAAVIVLLIKVFKPLKF
jgi:hypothetical protein